MQSTDWAGGPTAMGTLSLVPILGIAIIGASKWEVCGATTSGALVVGAISTDAGTGLLEEISQQVVFAGPG